MGINWDETRENLEFGNLSDEFETYTFHSCDLSLEGRRPVAKGRRLQKRRRAELLGRG